MSIFLLGDQTPTFPETFQRKLQLFDPDLLITWHRPPHWPKHRYGVWKIERCIRHFGRGFEITGRPLHDHTCERVYILMCQDEDGTPKPLGDWIFEKLREMRHNWEALGGDSEQGVTNALRASDQIERDMTEKREAASLDVKEHNRKDKRLQINKLMHLIEQHDMRPNK